MSSAIIPGNGPNNVVDPTRGVGDPFAQECLLWYSGKYDSCNEGEREYCDEFLTEP